MTQTNTGGGGFIELETSLIHPKVEIFFFIVKLATDADIQGIFTSIFITLFIYKKYLSGSDDHGSRSLLRGRQFFNRR